MTPIKFKKMNCTYVADGCGDLPACRADGQIVSCWKLTLRERIKMMITGRMWLSVQSRQQPPVWLGVESPFVRKE